MTVLFGAVLALFVIQGFVFLKYQRQVKDICRQLSFLIKNDSNMRITSEMDLGGLGLLKNSLNDLLDIRRRRKRRSLKFIQVCPMISGRRSLLWTDIFSFWRSARIPKNRNVISGSFRSGSQV